MLAHAPAPDGYVLRPLGADDAALVGQQQAAMLRDLGLLAEAQMARMGEASAAFVRGLFAQGTYFGYAAVSRDAPTRAVGGGGVSLHPQWPWAEAGRVTPAALQGLVLNVFVEAGHRRRGVARAILLALEAECAGRGVRKLTLHASASGRPLYASLGYEASNEMRLLHPPRRRF